MSSAAYVNDNFYRSISFTVFIVFPNEMLKCE